MRTPESDPLLAMMQAGDVAALDHIARAFGPRLVRIAMRCCRSPADAEDAVQNALLQARRAMTTYRGEGSPLAWLSTLVARSCYRLNERGERTLAVTPDCACNDPAAAVERRQLGERLGEALMQIPRTDRLLFLLSAEGWTGPEIATQFAMTPNAVRSRLKRTRQQLRDLLTDTLPSG